MRITTVRPDEVEALVHEWRTKTVGRRSAQRGTFTRDRERPSTYVQIVGLPSYDDAMTNSALLEPPLFTERLANLSDGPMVFGNLDVRSGEQM